jgi:AraC-like DNA-binding protein
MKESAFDNFFPEITYFYFRKCGPEWHILPHLVSNYDITYIIKGEARYTIDGTVYELGSGDLLCLNNGDEKKAVTAANNPLQHFAVNFSSRKPSSRSVRLPFPIMSHIGYRHDIIRLFRELAICWSQQNPGYIMRTRALLMLILNRLEEILVYDHEAAARDVRVSRAVRTIALRYPEKLTVRSLAGQENLDTVYFGSLFKKETGMTVHQYITRIRVQNAETMLQSGNYQVQEVAEQCGFCDVFHFYKSFKAIRGIPPSRCIP